MSINSNTTAGGTSCETIRFTVPKKAMLWECIALALSITWMLSITYILLVLAQYGADSSASVLATWLRFALTPNMYSLFNILSLLWIFKQVRG